jgi:hypothetical protein
MSESIRLIIVQLKQWGAITCIPFNHGLVRKPATELGYSKGACALLFGWWESYLQPCRPGPTATIFQPMEYPILT